MAEIQGRSIERNPKNPLTLYPVDTKENLSLQTLDIEGLGQYTVRAKAEHGNAYFAELITAYRRNVPQQIALKPFTVENATTRQQAANAFAREYDVLAQLHHSGQAVPRPIGIFEKDGQQKGSYLMTEFFGQHDLIDVVTSGRLTGKNMMLYYKLLLEQVSYMHKQKLFHGDIKPSNIRLTADGRIGLTDFGTVHRKQDNIVDYPRGIISEGYSAPEQVSPAFVPTATSDIFSLGMTLYFMLTRENPEESYTIPDPMYDAVLKRANLNSLPPLLRGFLYKMTAYRDRDRYQSVDAALKDLQTIIDKGQY